MRDRYIKFLFLGLILLCSQSVSAGDPPPILTSGSLKAQGPITNIPEGSYLRLVNFNKNWDNWFHEVKLVNGDNQALNNFSLKVSQEFLRGDLTNKINNNLQFIDEETGKTITGYGGQEYMIVGSQNTGWKTHSVQFLDQNGVLSDHKGIPTNGPRRYKISQKYLDADRFTSPVRNLGAIQDIASNGTGKDINCPKVSTTQQTNTPLAPQGKSSYTYLKSKRAELRKLGGEGCRAEKRRVEKEYLKKHPYGKLTKLQRADQIFTDSSTVYKNIVSSSNNTKTSHPYRDFVKGSYIDPVISPGVVSCIAYQETRTNLNPYSINYSLCNKKMHSSAHGLGQMTHDALKGMMSNPDGELVPMDSPNSKKYKGLSSREVHAQMSGDTGMQLEVTMRLLSANAKFIRWKNKGLTEKEILRRAVIQYDTESQSTYLKNVLDRCLPCFKKGGNGAKCYKTLKDK